MEAKAIQERSNQNRDDVENKESEADKYTAKWLAIKMCSVETKQKWSRELKFLDFVIRSIEIWNDEQLKILRAWITKKLDGREYLRKHRKECINR